MEYSAEAEAEEAVLTFFYREDKEKEREREANVVLVREFALAGEQRNAEPSGVGGKPHRCLMLGKKRRQQEILRGSGRG
jgi:hypothetical protein